MVVFCDFGKAVQWLSRHGVRDLEVVVTFDTRAAGSLAYSSALGDLKRKWSASRNRAYIELLGPAALASLPRDLRSVHHFWIKVGLSRLLLHFDRVALKSMYMFPGRNTVQMPACLRSNLS